MSEPAIPDLQRWSEEVANDPAAPAFLSLARAYRRQGHRDAALGICLRALERQPAHVEGHALLALLYLERGDRERASDEWATVLQLDPDNFEAHRGLGFVYLEKRDYAAALRHLERAAAARPEDPAVRDALVIAAAGAQEKGAAAPGADAWPWAAGSSTAGAPWAGSATAGTGAPSTAGARDPVRVFEELTADPSFLGALVLDIQGAVLAGALAQRDPDRIERLGTVLGETVEEGARMAGFLGLGAWEGIVLHTDAAVLHVTPLGEWTLVVAGTSDAQADWMLRASARAAELARAYVGGRA